jgi:hypothetical protein
MSRISQFVIVFAPDDIHITETRNTMCCVHWIEYVCLKYNSQIFNFQISILQSCQLLRLYGVGDK